MGLIYATLGEHQEAVRHFNEATSLDQYLAVAYVSRRFPTHTDTLTCLLHANQILSMRRIQLPSRTVRDGFQGL